MSPTDSPASSRTAPAAGQLAMFALLASVAAWLIAILYPSGPPAAGVMTYGWIWSQCTLLTLPGLACGAAIATWRPKVGAVAGGLGIVLVPLLVLGDAITFGWIGERLLSGSVWRLATSLRESLTNHVSHGTATFAILTVVAFVLGSAATWYSSGWLARRSAWRPSLVIAGMVTLACSFAIPALWQWQPARSDMADCSARHPLCAIGLVGYRGVGQDQRAAARREPPGGGLAANMEKLISERENRHLGLTVQRTDEPLRDAVIVIIESFRHELVDPEVMPTLWNYAQRGMHCRNHFSAGNATTHGMFGILNGLEAVWYSRQMHKAPLLNRLLRSAGYEIGFFAGHNDWKKFRMDGFINRNQFDVFQCDDPNWLKSDHRATQRAVNFLQRSGEQETAERKPRLAILYLYSTHADYHSYPQDRLFLPAADDRFVIPYTADSAAEVWNRYKNSARSIDRFLRAVLADDRVALITGDHGESFLEDGVCGHGVRVSRYQNTTPAVIYVPGQSAQVMAEPTMHADLLPTLLPALGLRISDPTVLDGLDLFDRTQIRLGERLFVTRNYLSDDCALIGRSLGKSCFGYRCAISLSEFQAMALNPIDEAGYAHAIAIDGEQLLKQWLEERFPDTH